MDPDTVIFTIEHLIESYKKAKGLGVDFFPKHKKDSFDQLAGTEELREQIENGWSKLQIEASWKKDLIWYKAIRKKYLLYPDFE